MFGRAPRWLPARKCCGRRRVKGIRSMSEAQTSGRFVVQRHQARTLHFDFRLEKEGVFKSWAVPKGLPEEAGVQRLAIATEDHELTFSDFAGEIPGLVVIMLAFRRSMREFRDRLYTRHCRQASARKTIRRSDGPAPLGFEPCTVAV